MRHLAAIPDPEDADDAAPRLIVSAELENLEPLVEHVVDRALAKRGLTAAGPTSPYLTVAEAADYLRCSRQRIYDLRSSGQLARYGDGSRALILRTELDALAGRPDPEVPPRLRRAS